MFTKIIVSLLIAAMATFGHDTHASHERCRHETGRHATYVQCESRTGNLVTYTFIRIVTVRV